MSSAVDHDTHASPGTVPGQAPATVTSLAVTGMTCSNCARHVAEALQGVAGVRSATVSLEGQQATVRWNTDVEPDTTALVKAVEVEGYGASLVVAGDDAAGHGEHRLSGWQRALWISVLGTLPLMLGEWVFGLGR